MRPAWYAHWVDAGLGDYYPLLFFPFQPRKLEKRGSAYVLAGRYPYDADVVDAVFDALRQNPAVMLYGPPGTGKTTMATLLARYLAPFSWVKKLEADLIPRSFGVNKFRPLLHRHHAVVIDDARFLLMKIVGESAAQATALLADVQVQLMDFLETCYDYNVAVFITTNVMPHFIDSAILSRVKAVYVPPPSAEVRKLLEELGYKIVDPKGRSFRELLRGTTADVVEIPPREVKMAWDAKWLLTRNTVYRLSFGHITLPIEMVAKVAAVFAHLTGRKAVYVKAPGGLDQLYYYDRPIVVIRGGLFSLSELLRIAAQYNATVLTDDPSAELLQADEPTLAVCPEAKVNIFTCFRKAVEELYGR